MYQQHFALADYPFSLTPNTNYYCALPSHNEAMQVLLAALNMGEGFIKVTGEVGTGKTLLCRKLLNLMTEPYIAAYIPNPYVTPDELRQGVAKELGINIANFASGLALADALQQRLLDLVQDGKRVVIILDEAQAMSWDSLEALRLMTNLETEQQKLLQVVLFGQPELERKLMHHSIRQLQQRITFSFRLRKMTLAEVKHYIGFRLAVAGSDRPLISGLSLYLLAYASKGVPRLVNILCHKALLLAYGAGRDEVAMQDAWQAISDTPGAQSPWRAWPVWLAAGATAMLLTTIIIGVAR